MPTESHLAGGLHHARPIMYECSGMSDTDDMERDLRLELMRLDRKLKVRDLRRMDQRLVYEPLKLGLLAAFVGALVALLLLSLWFA